MSTGSSPIVEQGYPAFRSPYQGANSLTGASQIQNTTSATAFVGYRPWDGTEIYVNPELMQGFGLNNTLGVAGFPNGEAQKSDFPMPRIDIARVFVRQTFGLGGEQETVEDGPNQLAGKQDISRITVTAGRFAVIDIFDGNSYSHDPRVDFLNWNMYCCGSYDLTMDKISYTWGAAAELNQKNWAIRAGYFLVPAVSNVNTFDTHIPEHGEYIGELELRYSLFSQPGKLRLMGWANIANVGSYADALAMPVTTPNYPDITQTRQVRTNYGFVVNVEQAITSDLGVFSRASWSPGLVEIIGWTDCDESLSFGTVLKGNAWGRPDDKIGVAGVVEGLSPDSPRLFRRRRPGDSDRRWPAQLSPGADPRSLLRLQPQQMGDAHLRLSVRCQSRIQCRPRTGFGLLWTLARTVLIAIRAADALGRRLVPLWLCRSAIGMTMMKLRLAWAVGTCCTSIKWRSVARRSAAHHLR